MVRSIERDLRQFEHHGTIKGQTDYAKRIIFSYIVYHKCTLCSSKGIGLLFSAFHFSCGGLEGPAQLHGPNLNEGHDWQIMGLDCTATEPKWGRRRLPAAVDGQRLSRLFRSASGGLPSQAVPLETSVFRASAGPPPPPPSTEGAGGGGDDNRIENIISEAEREEGRQWKIS